MERRFFLRKLLKVAATPLFLTPATLLADPRKTESIILTVTREETGEYRKMIMTKERSMQNYIDLCWLGRDVRKREVRPLNPALLDRWWSLYSMLNRAIGFDGHFVLQSGYRSDATNREVGGSVNSWHKKGSALDFHAEGVDMKALSSFVRLSHGGGVGYYKRNNSSRGWMHIDEGSSRYWEG